MDTLKVPLMEKSIIKIGIIGPRSNSLGGHDKDNKTRTFVKKQICNIFSEYNKSGDKVILGITGLGLGVEQDFAEMCIEYKNDYVVYLPFEDQESLWIDLPSDITDNYKFLLKHAFKTQILSEGSYSPKKIATKHSKVIRESDLIIIVNDNVIKNSYDTCLSICKKLNKTYVVINV